jgi:hypothetical protein
MRVVDVVDLAGEVLPRRWVRRFVTSLLLCMLATGSVATALWYSTAKAAAIEEDLAAPMLEQITKIASPAPTVPSTP